MLGTFPCDFWSPGDFVFDVPRQGEFRITLGEIEIPLFIEGQVLMEAFFGFSQIMSVVHESGRNDFSNEQILKLSTAGVQKGFGEIMAVIEQNRRTDFSSSQIVHLSLLGVQKQFSRMLEEPDFSELSSNQQAKQTQTRTLVATTS